jgi:hypothetical protein
MFENFGDSGFSSVRGQFGALMAEAQSTMADLAHAFRRSALTLKSKMAVPGDLVKAAHGEPTTPEAKAFYDAFNTAAETLRQAFNKAGGSIKWRSDWGIPMHHNSNAVMVGGMDRWMSFINDRLDWEKMTSPLTGERIPEAERPAVLEHVWNSIVQDGWNTRTPTRGSGGRAALYNQRQDARFLSFKDSKAWSEYNEAYGSGDVWRSMTNHIRGMAMDVALMQRLGPNPRATVEWMKQNLDNEAAKIRAGQPSFMNAKPLSAAMKAFKGREALDALYDSAKGYAVPYSAVGNGIGIIRDVQYAAKLGSAVITHTFSNTVIQGMGRYMHGGGLGDIIRIPLDIARNLKDSKELAQSGVILQDMTHSLAAGAREQNSWKKVGELAHWLPAITTHYSGLDAVVNANRRSWGLWFMGQFANEMDKPLNQMSRRVGNVLKGYGITPAEWEVIRLAEKYEPERGAEFLRGKEISDVGANKPDEVAAILGHENVDPAATEAATIAIAHKYLEALTMSTEAAVPSKNWRAVALPSQIAKRGAAIHPAIGEAVRSLMMFKSGFMATFMLTQRDMWLRELQSSRLSAAGYAALAPILLTLAGMMTLQVKNLAVGKDLRPIDPSTEQGRETWAHAGLTSGALGIMGDYIAADRSSFGHDLLSTMAGPMVTGAEDAFHGTKSLLVGNKNKTREELAEGMGVRFWRNNTPVLSTHWALRAAYNRMILDQLQQLADPHAHEAMRKTESKVRTETNQQYWWRPGQTAPDRLPLATTARH